MRYRALDDEGDFVFGQGSTEFLINTPETVGQAVQTRLKLAQGEWYLDRQEGTPYSTKILGENTFSLYDAAIQQRILDTPGVTSIDAYASVFDGTTRKLTVTATISTIYGVLAVNQVL